jgi:hypothetical protein
VRAVFLFLLLLSTFAGAETLPEGKQYNRIWLRSKISLMNFTWNDVGLSKEASFIAPLEGAWKKWLVENLPSNVVDAEICLEACAVAFEKWQEQTPRQLATSQDPTLAAGVWLRVDIDLWKEGPTHYRWQGRAVLLDMKTKHQLGSFDLGREERRYPEVEQIKINSALASQIYRSPLSAFLHLTKTLGKTPPLDKVAQLRIKGHKTLSDVLDLLKLLQTRGSQLGLSVSLDNFESNGATLLCLFRGEEKSFNDLLSQLKELKSSHRYTLVNQSTAPDYVLQFVVE